MSNASEFVDELSGHTESRFHSIYRGILDDRFVHQDEHCVVIPTIGQLFRGSLLVVPKTGVEVFSDLPANVLTSILSVVYSMRMRLSEWGDVVLFEHGARVGTGRNCGVYHAHLHIIPLPHPISVAEVFQGDQSDADSLPDAYRELHLRDHYLLMQDCRGNTAFLTGNAASAEVYRSQFFRRWLVRRFGLTRPSDWREYTAPESDLIDTVKALKM